MIMIEGIGQLSYEVLDNAVVLQLGEATIPIPFDIGSAETILGAMEAPSLEELRTESQAFTEKATETRNYMQELTSERDQKVAEYEQAISNGGPREIKRAAELKIQIEDIDRHLQLAKDQIKSPHLEGGWTRAEIGAAYDHQASAYAKTVNEALEPVVQFFYGLAEAVEAQARKAQVAIGNSCDVINKELRIRGMPLMSARLQGFSNGGYVNVAGRATIPMA